MPVPKRKLSRKRRDQRSANKGLEPKSLAACQTCQAPNMPHQVCRECGYYKGTKVLRTKVDRMYTRGQAREALAASRGAAMAPKAPAESTGAGEGAAE
ncbi:50S ribosomal protein L32 [bacterium]|nr:50S ribosomal protein L32 [bacterium]